VPWIVIALYIPPSVFVNPTFWVSATTWAVIARLASKGRSLGSGKEATRRPLITKPRLLVILVAFVLVFSLDATSPVARAAAWGFPAFFLYLSGWLILSLAHFQLTRRAKKTSGNSPGMAGADSSQGDSLPRFR
jgi:hypothetical protein